MRVGRKVLGRASNTDAHIGETQGGGSEVGYSPRKSEDLGDMRETGGRR